MKSISTKNIILLGFTSLINDTSSEIIFPLLPFFLLAIGGSEVIGIGLILGLVGGLGDGVASVLKAISGYWSDKIHKKKPFVMAGYSISAVSKIFFPISQTWEQVTIVRIVERTGKGIRNAPRDAIIAESSEEKKGRGFGIHRAMDTAGAFLGGVILLFFILYFGIESGTDIAFMQTVLIFAAILAFFALIPLIFVKTKGTVKPSGFNVGFKNLPRKFFLVLIVTGLFAFGNFTYMFFIIQVRPFFVGTELFIATLLYILFNLTYTLFSIPAGNLSDSFGKSNVLVLGYGLFSLTCLIFIFSQSLVLFILGFAVYGTALAFVDGVQRAFISDLVPQELRGTALGTFHMITGLAAIPAGIIAGFLFSYVGAIYTFIYGAVIGGISLILLLFLTKEFK
ncbi:MAG: MFS transporter [Candidatus Helarchaeota archaeon]